MKHSFRTLLLVLVMGALLAACGGVGNDSGNGGGEPVSYTIEMTEYAFNPATLNLKVGQTVTLELVNNGALIHEIMFGRGVKMENNRPTGYETDMFEAGGETPVVSGGGAGEEEEGQEGFVLILPETGDTATMTFDVTEGMVGQWEIGCFEQEGVHYDAGMKGTVTVAE